MATGCAVKHAEYFIRPGDVLLYSPCGTEEFPAIVCDEQLMLDIGWVTIKFKFEGLELQSTVPQERLRIADKTVAEDRIRQRLSDMAADTFGVDVPTEMWGEL